MSQDPRADEIRKIIRRSPALAPDSVARNFRPGAVFIARDDVIQLPEGRTTGAGPRSEHPGRHVILLQARELAISGKPVTMLVVPCSASFRQDVGGVWNLRIPRGCPGFDKPNVVAMVNLLQPMLKGELERHLGDVPEDFLLDLQACAARVLGLRSVSPLRMPDPKSPR